MSTPPRVPHSVFFLVIPIFLFLSGCGGAISETGGSFSGNGSSAGGSATISSVDLSPSTVTGGAASTGTIALSAAAPTSGAEVLLSSSNPSAAAVPAKVMVAQGQTSATFQATTAAVASATSVTISASYNNSVVGAKLTVNPQPAPNPPPAPPPTPTPDFTFGVSPPSLSVAQGSSAVATVTTTVNGGFNTAVTLISSGAPASTSVSYNPASIAAPGSGTSQVTITAASSVPTGTYPIVLTGFGGGVTHTATISLTVTPASSGVVGPLRGCLLTDTGHQYQAVEFSLSAPATLPFDGLLFRGATCDPTQKVDEIGFGAPLQFGGFGWTFWFIHFPDQLNTSAIWTVDTQKSACIDYSTAPPC